MDRRLSNATNSSFEMILAPHWEIRAEARQWRWSDDVGGLAIIGGSAFVVLAIAGHARNGRGTFFKKI